MHPTLSTMSSRKKPADCQSITSFFAKRSRLGNIRVLNLNRTVVMKHEFIYAIDTESSTVTTVTACSAPSSPVQQPTTSSSNIGTVGLINLFSNLHKNNN